MTVKEKPRRVLVVARQNDDSLPTWINGLLSSGSDIHVFPLDAAPLPSDLTGVAVHQLFTPLRPRLMWHLLTHAPEQLWAFPNYEAHLQSKYRSDFVYPIPYLQLPGRPAAAISRGLRKTGSHFDIRPAALTRTIKHVRPDLILSLGIDHAAAITLSARARFGPEFPTWLLCASEDRLSERKASDLNSREISRIFCSVDFFAYDREADLTSARELGLTGLGLPFGPPSLIHFDFDRLAPAMPFPPSGRRTILVDCTNGRPECVLAVLGALDSHAEIIQNYMTVICGAAHVAIFKEVTRIQRKGRFPVRYERQPFSTCPPELIGSSRMYFGMPCMGGKDSAVSLIFAAAMGAFPIQVGDLKGTNWSQLELSGLSVGLSEIERLTSGIESALTDNALVDNTAEQNLALARRKFSKDSEVAEQSERQLRELFDEIFIGPRPLR